MSKPKKELNPKLAKGDRIMCLHMEGETSVPMGTTGTVSRISRDPFEVDSDIITVDWDNGSTLGLLTTTDTWIKVKPDNITEETGDAAFNYFIKNPDIFEYFDRKFLIKYLNELRDASPVNMLQSAPFLYSGSEWIERYYGENQQYNESFQNVLEMADEAKDKMIQGVLKYMDSKDIDMDGDMDKFNRLMRKFSTAILELYISFS
jgi:hypothetical protein